MSNSDKKVWGGEEILDAVFEYVDGQPWLPAGKRPAGVSWSDHETAALEAGKVAVQSLVAGHQAGHARDTTPCDVAKSLRRQFEGFFSNRRRYYVGTGLGASQYAYRQGEQFWTCGVPVFSGLPKATR